MYIFVKTLIEPFPFSTQRQTQIHKNVHKPTARILPINFQKNRLEMSHSWIISHVKKSRFFYL